jgi:hypothetical protein
MKDKVLILTNSLDGEHTDSVINALKRKGSKYFRCDTDKISSGEVRINLFAKPSSFGFSIHSDAGVLESEDIYSVWYRRPNEFNLQIEDPAQKEFTHTEISAFLNGLWLSISDAYWLSNPHSIEKARRKILQLKLAKTLGFRIPDTIVTNDPNEVKRFFLEHGERIIFKTMHQEFISISDKKFNIPTTLINAGHMDKIGLVSKLPSLFQEYVEKSYELRVTIVKDKVFTAKIYSQDNPLSIVDWRNPLTIDKLKYESVELPMDIMSLCFSMMESLGLVFGAFDFMVDKSGKMFFLEINPNGQWYWLEHFCGFEISSAISEALTT